jgi:hypothetical protein
MADNDTPPSVPKPGTPEWNEQYEAAVKALDAEEAKNAEPQPPAPQPEKKSEPPAAITPEPEKKVEEPPKTPEPNPEIEQLRKELESSKKALKDTKAWASKLSEELAGSNKKEKLSEVEKTQEAALKENPDFVKILEAERKRNEILNAKEEDLVPPPPAEPQATEKKVETPDDDYDRIVLGIHPDLGVLRKDKVFNDTLVAAAKQAGEKWDNPLEAARIISDVKLKVEKEKIAAQAVEKAKLELMQEGPGNGSKPAPLAPTKTDEQQIAEIHAMSDEEWDRYMAKKGYNT